MLYHNASRLGANTDQKAEEADVHQGGSASHRAWRKRLWASRPILGLPVFFVLAIVRQRLLCAPLPCIITLCAHDTAIYSSDRGSTTVILALLEALPAFFWNVVHRFKLQKGSCFHQSLSFSFGLTAVFSPRFAF